MATTALPPTQRPVKNLVVNFFHPSSPHAKQLEILDDPARFKLIRAGRKFRKTSLMISWLFEQAIYSKLTCPYIAPNRVQAKNIAWRDHVTRALEMLRKQGVPHEVNIQDLSVTLPGGGRVQLLGVDNKEALRGISNWGAVGADEYDDWEEDIWPTVIRPNLTVHQAPAMVAGTPKGMRGMYKLAQGGIFKEFHYTSYDNPELSRDELAALEKEYKELGEDYYRQEIMADYVKPVGLVYKEWNLDNYRPVAYDPLLPLHITFDWGINDPTAVIWLQPYGGEVRIVDYYEASDANIEHFISVIRSKPYKTADLYTGDPAGKARTLTTGTSVIELLAQKGIHVRTKDGVKIPEQIRLAHSYMARLFVNSEKCERFRDCLINYRYPHKPAGAVNQENEIPIHDQFSHAMRAFEYWCVCAGDLESASHALEVVRYEVGLGGAEIPVYNF